MSVWLYWWSLISCTPVLITCMSCTCYVIQCWLLVISLHDAMSHWFTNRTIILGHVAIVMFWAVARMDYVAYNSKWLGTVCTVWFWMLNDIVWVHCWLADMHCTSSGEVHLRVTAGWGSFSLLLNQLPCRLVVWVSCDVSTYGSFVNCGVSTYKSLVFCDVSTYRSLVNCDASTYRSLVYCDVSTYRSLVNCDVSSYKSLVVCDVSTYRSLVVCGVSIYRSLVNNYCDVSTSRSLVNCDVSTYRSPVDSDVSTYRSLVNCDVSTYR